MTMDEQRINDYLTRYATALAEFDAEAAVELWSTPGMIADDRFSGVLDDTNSYYLLRDEDAGLRAVVCIETDTMENLQELAARKGVTLPSSV